MEVSGCPFRDLVICAPDLAVEAGFGTDLPDLPTRPIRMGLLGTLLEGACNLAGPCAIEEAISGGNWAGVALEAAMLLPIGKLGKLGKLAKIAEGVEDVGDTGRLVVRAGEIHSVLDPIAQTSRTTAVLGTTTREGLAIDVLAGGVRDLSPAQRALAASGDVLARLPGEHAEITALKAASEAGLIPRAIASTWDICPACRAALEESGAMLTGPRAALWWRGL
jgi:hypothetical protein